MSTFDTVTDAIDDIRAGRMVVVVDDEDRENEGDLIMAAEHVTPEAILFMAKQASGLICTPISSEVAARLALAPMVSDPHEVRGCNFTVTIDAREGITTGISPEDRAVTIRKMVGDEVCPADFVRPGHVFPLIARDGGVLIRAGHTEAACDLAKMAGLKSAGVICEIMNDDGTMARVPDLMVFAKKHGLKIITIKDLIEFRRSHETLVERKAEAFLPTEYGDFKMYVYQDVIEGREHVAMVHGDVAGKKGVMVRVHSECMTGDVFGSLRCDCGPQLHKAMDLISQEDVGIILYLRHEGRGIGLINKMKSYVLQDQGYDTVEANRMLGFADDLRDYSVGAQMLCDLGVHDIRLLTNNPLKFSGLEERGIHVESVLPLEIIPNDRNRKYLKTKKQKMGHTLKEV